MQPRLLAENVHGHAQWWGSSCPQSHGAATGPPSERLSAPLTPSLSGSPRSARCPSQFLAGSFQGGVDSFYKQLTLHPDVVHNEMARYQIWGEEGKPMSEYAGKNGASVEALRQSPTQRILIDGSSSTFAFYWSAGLRTHQGFQRGEGGIGGPVVWGG